MAARIEIRGIDRTLRKMRRLPKRVAKSADRKAVSAGATVVGRAIRAATPRGNKAEHEARDRRAQSKPQKPRPWAKLSKSVDRKVYLDRRTESYVAVVGVTSAAPHGHILEYDDNVRKGWASDAIEQIEGQAVARVAEKLAEEVSKALRKL